MKLYSTLLLFIIIFPVQSQIIECEGTYSLHLQGIHSDSDQNIYWSFTNALVKTDLQGKLIKKIEVPNHFGGLTVLGEHVYGAVNLGSFNTENGGDSWVYKYDKSTLQLLKKYKLNELKFGAGGIAYDEITKQFLVIGGLPEGYDTNFIYQYDQDFSFIQKTEVKSGYTKYGIQTAIYLDDIIYLGCYGSPPVTLMIDKKTSELKSIETDTSLGLLKIGDQYYGGRWDGKSGRGWAEEIKLY